jgi:hypothetical protein
MILDEFVAKYTGVPVDFDGAYGNQCFDLYRKYVQDVLGFPQSPSTGTAGAKTIWDNYLKDYFEAISNTPTGYPQKGDIVIWGSVYGKFGHVAICIEATVNTFKCFSQNDPEGALPAIKWYKNYTGVLGWLRAKQQTDPAKLQSELEEQRKQVSNLQNQVNGLLVNISDWSKKYDECNTQRIEAGASADGFRKQLNDFVAKLASLLGTRQEVPEIIASIETAITFEDKAVELDRKLALEVKEHQADVESFGKEIAGLKTQLASLETKYKELKDTQITPTQPTQKYSILELLKKLFGG